MCNQKIQFVILIFFDILSYNFLKLFVIISSFSLYQPIQELGLTPVCGILSIAPGICNGKGIEGALIFLIQLLQNPKKLILFLSLHGFPKTLCKIRHESHEIL